MKDINSVADYILVSFEPQGISPLKLQKLLYYTQAWHLALYDTPFFEGDFEAWVHGPVNPEIYKRFAEEYGMYTPISTQSKGYKFSNQPCINDEKSRDFLNEILDVYGGFTGDQLEHLTHMELPWKSARRGLTDYERSTNKIDPNCMRDYYRARLQNEQEQEANSK